MSEENSDFIHELVAIAKSQKQCEDYLKSPDTELCAKILAEEFHIEKYKLAATYLIENKYASDILKHQIFLKLAADFPETFFTYPMATITPLIVLAETQMLTQADPLPAFILEFFRRPCSLLPYSHTDSKETE
jgi:hypothetical protein